MNNWLINGSALGPTGGLSARQFNSCLPQREDIQIGFTNDNSGRTARQPDRLGLCGWASAAPHWNWTMSLLTHQLTHQWLPSTSWNCRCWYTPLPRWRNIQSYEHDFFSSVAKNKHRLLLLLSSASPLPPWLLRLLLLLIVLLLQ